ncbi:MAG: TolC family protein [Catalinimonas sp.]
MRNRLLLFLLALGPFGLTVAQERLTLPDVLAEALENNLAVRLVELRRDSLANQLTPGNAGLLPLVTAGGRREYRLNDTRQQFLDGRGNEIDNARADVLTGSVDAVWTVFDGGGSFTAYKVLQTLERTGELNQQAVVENLVADVTAAYFNVVQQAARVGAFDNTLVISEQRLQLAQDQYEVGTGTKAEYLAAQADRNADRSALLDEQRRLQVARVDLNELLVRSPEASFVVADTVIPVNDTLHLPALRDRLRVQNTALAEARLRRELATLRARTTRTDFWPELDLFGSYGYNRLNSEAGFLVENRQVGFTYGATVRVNLFDGLNQWRRVQNARIAEQVRAVEIADLEVALDAAVVRAHYEYLNSLDRARLEEENLEIAEERVSIELDRYRIGVSTPLQLREAQRNTVDVQRRLIEATFAAKLAETELLRLTGGLVSRTAAVD